MLGLLVDYGLAERVCKMFDASDDDLQRLAELEMECRQLAKEQAGESQENG